MNGYTPLAPFVSPPVRRRRPTARERLAADALGWVGDVEALLTQGAVCTCAPELRCSLHERLDYAEGCIRAGSGAAL